MDYSSKDVSNNLTLHMIKTEKFKTNSITVYFNIPLNRENLSNSLLITSILKNCSLKYDSLTKVSRHAETLYGAHFDFGIKKIGDVIVLYFSINSIRNDFIKENVYEKMIDFLKEMIFFPLVKDEMFFSEILNQEKESLKIRINSIKDDKKISAEIKCIESMFENENFALSEIGYSEDLDKYSHSAYSFYKNILNNSKVDIFSTGFFEEEMSFELISKNFLPYLNNVKQEYSRINPLFRKEIKKKYVKIKDDLEQNQKKVCLSYVTNSENNEIEIFSIINAIFGNGTYSKLFLNVREKLSLAYYCNSKFDRNKRIIIVSSGISKENEEALINEIEKQLNDIKSGNITDKEILYAKNHLKNQFYSIRDSKSLIEFFYYNQLFYVEHGSLEECVERIFTVEKKDILKSSEKINLDTVLVQ